MSGPSATIDGQPIPLAAAIDRAARLLAGARRVLVTGLADAPLEAIAKACDLAETLGAAVDADAKEIASPAGPVLTRAGGITADPGELADRADLVIAWFCGIPRAEAWAARLDHRPVAGQAPSRRLLAVGPAAPAGWAHVPLDAGSGVDAARLVQLILAGDGSAGSLVGPVPEACSVIATTIRGATCVGFVAGPPADRLGLAGWSLARLVRFLAHRQPAFVVSLAGPPAEWIDNAAGAAALLTWRYGAAGAIAKADRQGGDYRPAEIAASALIGRGEVDAILAVGRLSAATEGAIADRAADLSIVRIDTRTDPPPGAAGRCIHVRCLPGGGTILGSDGRERSLEPSGEEPEPRVAVLAELHARLREAAS